MPAVRVVLADDHPVVREGLKSILQGQDSLEVVGEADDGAAAATLAATADPDVVVLDVSMPGMTATAAVERVRQANPRCKVLALSIHEDSGYVRLMLSAGASGYAFKRSAAAELVRGIRSVAAGQTYLDPALAARDGLAAADVPAAPDDLSPREVEVLRLIAEGFSNKEIAARLLLSVKTVETYKARSLEKLGLRTRVDLIRYAARRGWLADL